MALPYEITQKLSSRSLDEYFSASVRKHAARPALYLGGKTYSYRELGEKSAAIEQRILAAGFHGKQNNIGVLYARSAFAYAAIIAIMKTGNVYVPLNVNTPADRLLKILTDANIEALVIASGDPLPHALLSVLQTCKALHVIAERATSAQIPSAHFAWLVDNASSRPNNLLRVADHSISLASRLAYIIYTSGSTGEPKGVPITHDSACRCIEKLHGLFDTHEHDRFTQFSALSFDVSIMDIFLCWKSGATLYVPAASENLVPLTFVATHKITVWSSVPSLANILLKLKLLKGSCLRHIRLSLFCGEALPRELANAWATAAPSSRIFNLYGPTEATIVSTYYEYRQSDGCGYGIVPIGTPLANLCCAIVADGELVETENTSGELWLSGDQLAGGYWNNPSATAAAFVQLPSDTIPGRTWYRTGDLVIRTRDDGLSFLGRIDRQVKLRGHRVELQEIESALRDVTGCTLVAVVALRSAGGICEKIVAYCDEINGDEAAIKSGCLARLPRYMVPDQIYQLTTFPLNANGKIDYVELTARSHALTS